MEGCKRGSLKKRESGDADRLTPPAQGTVPQLTPCITAANRAPVNPVTAAG
jgi:hypothetical protein